MIYIALIILNAVVECYVDVFDSQCIWLKYGFKNFMDLNLCIFYLPSRSQCHENVYYLSFEWKLTGILQK